MECNQDNDHICKGGLDPKHNRRKAIASMDRKFMSGIFEGKQTNVVWKLKSNEKVINLYGKAKMVLIIRDGKLRWLGHVKRKSMLIASAGGGTPKKR